MTNSTLSVKRPRQVQRVRALAILGVLFLSAVVIVTFLLRSASFRFNFSGFGKASDSRTGSTKVAAVQAKPAAPRSTAMETGSNSAASVEALDKATRKLSDEISKTPSDPSLQNRLGLIYLTLGDSNSSEQCFKNAVSLSRGSLSNYSAEVEKLKKTGKMADASNLVLEAARISVELTAAHSNLARLYDQRGDKQAAISELEQINKDGLLFNGFACGGSGGGGAKLNSGDSNLSTQDAQMLAQAEGLFKANQLPAALLLYRKLVQANAKLAFAYDRIGIISVMTGDLSGGVEAWEKAQKLNPNSAAIANNLGLAYHQMGMDRESEQSFRKALSLDPSMEEAALNLGDILSSRGQISQASAVMQEASKHNKSSARIANNLGTFLSLSGDYTDAISAFHRATSIDSNMASAHYGMGVALMKSHKYMPAMHELKIALALNPRLQDAQTKIEESQKLAGLRH